MISIRHLGGAISRIGDTETAVANRRAQYLLSVESTWEDPADDEKNIAWTHCFWSDMHRFSGGGVYSDRTGDLEALHWGNTEIFGHSVRSHAVPIKMVLRDIQHNSSSIPYRKARQAVWRLLSRRGVSAHASSTNTNIQGHQKTVSDQPEGGIR